MNNLTVTMPMQEYLELKKRAGEPDRVADFLDKLTEMYKIAPRFIGEPAAKFTGFDSLQDVCFAARKLLELELPPKGSY